MPAPPSPEELLTWGPAVLERMRHLPDAGRASRPANGAVGDQASRRKPKRPLSSNPSRHNSAAGDRDYPRHMDRRAALAGGAGGGALIALIGWTVYRETHLPGPGNPAPVLAQ